MTRWPPPPFHPFVLLCAARPNNALAAAAIPPFVLLPADRRAASEVQPSGPHDNRLPHGFAIFPSVCNRTTREVLFCSDVSFFTFLVLTANKSFRKETDACALSVPLSCQHYFYTCVTWLPTPPHYVCTITHQTMCAQRGRV